jgi:hypothetical protein
LSAERTIGGGEAHLRDSSKIPSRRKPCAHLRESEPPVEYGMPDLIPDLAPDVESVSDLIVPERDRERRG